MLYRTREGGEERKSQLIQETGNTDLEVFPVELSSMKTVADTADKLLARNPSIDLLMNNAGTMSPHFIQTEDGFEQTTAVNYLAPYLLTRKLLPNMHAGSRIVSMVSCTYQIGHIGPHFSPTDANQTATGAFRYIAIPSWPYGSLPVNFPNVSSNGIFQSMPPIRELFQQVLFIWTYGLIL